MLFVFSGTYAVQSIQIIEFSAILEVKCLFAPNTIANVGCVVEIVFLLNKIVVGTKTKRANRTEDRGLVTFQKLVADEYNLNVFEIERNGLLIQALTELSILLIQPLPSENENSMQILPTSSAVLQITTTIGFISE